jgi:HSP20 family protein
MAQLVPRRERGELVSLRDAIDRLFEEAFVRPWSEFFPWSARYGEMAVDVLDEGDKIVVEASMPGVKPEDVDVRIQGNMLTIKAESKREKEVSEDKYVYKERSYGMMQRSVSLPVEVDADKAEAVLEHGVLRLSLPKVAAEKARQIKVKPAK